MAASSLYSQARTKEILNIASGDAADNTELDALGAVSNIHIDNILEQHDEKIPLSGALLTVELIQAACYYTAHLFQGKRDADTSKLFKDMFTDIINGVIEQRSIEGLSYDVQRFHNRYRSEEDVFRLW